MSGYGDDIERGVYPDLDEAHTDWLSERHDLDYDDEPDPDAYDALGFDAKGIHAETGTRFGPDGFDRDGLDADNYTRDGMNIFTMEQRPPKAPVTPRKVWRPKSAADLKEGDVISVAELSRHCGVEVPDADSPDAVAVLHYDAHPSAGGKVHLTTALGEFDVRGDHPVSAQTIAETGLWDKAWPHARDLPVIGSHHEPRTVRYVRDNGDGTFSVADATTFVRDNLAHHREQDDPDNYGFEGAEYSVGRTMDYIVCADPEHPQETATFARTVTRTAEVDGDLDDALLAARSDADTETVSPMKLGWDGTPQGCPGVHDRMRGIPGTTLCPSAVTEKVATVRHDGEEVTVKIGYRDGRPATIRTLNPSTGLWGPSRVEAHPSSRRILDALSRCPPHDRLVPERVAAKAGQSSGVCLFCSRPLSDPRSRERGYGPECAGKAR